MREALLGKLLPLLVQATPEELAAICRFLTGEPLPEPEEGAPGSPPKQLPADTGLPGDQKADNREQRTENKQLPADTGFPGNAGAGSRYMFRRVGKHWKVIFRSGRAFRLRNILGARYLNHLLHAPNQGIGAFELEVEIQPEKGQARVRDSIQPESDPQAVREYRQELRQLQGEREKAQAAGRREQVERLNGQIAALEAALKEGGGTADTGERARDNVRKAIAIVLEQLKEGGPEERAFAEHLGTHLSIGHECLYSQPQGRIWS